MSTNTKQFSSKLTSSKHISFLSSFQYNIKQNQNFMGGKEGCESYIFQNNQDNNSLDFTEPALPCIKFRFSKNEIGKRN